jgi:hypothetical protein
MTDAFLFVQYASIYMDMCITRLMHQIDILFFPKRNLRIYQYSVCLNAYRFMHRLVVDILRVFFLLFMNIKIKNV